MEWTQRIDEWDATAKLGGLVQIGDRAVPREITATRDSVDGDRPALTIRLEVVHGVPRCQEAHVVAVDGGREIRPVDLKLDYIDELVKRLFSRFALPVEQVDEGTVRLRPHLTLGELKGSEAAVRGARKGRTPRTITPRLLERVADVYLAADRAPRLAVAKAFGVSDRMAAEYVRQARENDLIPPVKGR
jgi:hypothetical protein